MARPDVEVAGRAAAARQFPLFVAEAAQGGNEVELNRPPQAAAASAAADASCGGLRTQDSACASAAASSLTTVHVGAAAAAPAPSLESAVAGPAFPPGDRSVALGEAAIASSLSSAVTASRSTAGSAPVSAAVADGNDSSLDPAAQVSESGDVEAAPTASVRSSDATGTPGEPEATASSSEAVAPAAEAAAAPVAAAEAAAAEAAATAEAAAAEAVAEEAAGIAEAAAAEAAGTAEAAPGVQVSGAAGHGTSVCELEYVYVGQDCFFLELPDGTLACVAGLENLPAASPSARGADDTEGRAEGAGEEQIMLARLQCHNCLQLLEFDSRAYFVQCSSCLTLNAVPNQANSLRGGRAMIVICGRCSTRNISCLGSVYVECWQCHTVCQVDYPTPAAAAGLVNGQGSSAAASAVAAAAAAAAGDAVTPAAQLDFSGRGGAAGLFGTRGSRGRLHRLQRRLPGGFWRSDEEESSVSAAGGGRGTRLSTTVELPPALPSRGHGRSLLARHSFNPLPPRNLRVHVGGRSGGASSSSSSCREGTSSEAATAAAQGSSPSTQLQQMWLQRRQHRERLRWRARPGTVRAGVRAAGGPPSEAGSNSSRLLSLLFRLPFHGKSSGAERRATTATALSRGPKNLQRRNIGASSEEVEHANKSRRTRRPGRRAPAQVLSDRSVSDGSRQGESDDADERVAADRAGEASERDAGRLARRRSTRGMETPEGTSEVTETVEGYDARQSNRATLRHEADASSEAEDGRRSVSRQAPRRGNFTENESGDLGAAPAGGSDSFVQFDPNPGMVRRREAAASDAAETPTDTQETFRDTAYPLSPSVSFVCPTGRPGDSGEGTSSAGSSRAPPPQRSAGNACSVPEARAAAAAPAGEAPATATAATRRNWMLSFAGSIAHARGVGQNDTAALTATAAHTNAALQSNGELQPSTPLQVDPAAEGTDALRKSWRNAIRHWRPQERKETARARRLKYNIGTRRAGAVP